MSIMVTLRFDPQGGTYPGSVTVSICKDDGSIFDTGVYYTLDGSELLNPPGTNGIFYSGPITITQTSTLKAAVAFLGVAFDIRGSATYTIVPNPAPAINPPGSTYKNNVNVSLSFERPEAKICYTLTGGEPTSSSSSYSSPIPLPTPGRSEITVRAKAFVINFMGMCIYKSSESAATYKFKAATPAISPKGGTYDNTPITVSITCETSDAEIRYTVNGAEPAGSTGVKYIGPFGVTKTVTITAKAFKTNYSPSDTTSETYTFKVATPVIQPPSGTYPGIAINASISCSTRNAEIYYTRSGSRSTYYTGPFAVPLPVSGTATVTAQGYRTDFINSDTASESYKPGSSASSPSTSTVAGTGVIGISPRHIAVTSPLPSGSTARVSAFPEFVMKRKGSVQPFSQSKLVTSMVKAGATQPQATVVAKRVASRISEPTVTSTQLSGMTARSLSKVNTTAAQNYTAYRDQKSALRRKP